MKEQYLDLLNKLDEIKNRQKELKDQEDLIKKKLEASIPPNSEKGGVFHERQKRKAVSYSKATDAIVTLVPKTKLNQVNKIMEENTNWYEISKFKAV
ncbi:hypothetical protein GF354_03285 [Candidatus Peregrinibacteria bacterium]|nr:hypothetical protein [Candidatus Peregrinibacteria bacterium]